MVGRFRVANRQSTHNADDSLSEVVVDCLAANPPYSFYREMLAQGVRKAELARRLGWKAPQVDRLFDLGHASRLDQLEAAAKALGKHIDVTLA